MKKLFLILSILPMFLTAQEGDWFPVPSDQTAYYEYIGTYSLENIKPYRIDSIVDTPDGKIYYNIRTPEIFYYYYYEQGYLHDPKASWIGKKTVISQNNAYIYNKYDLPIYLPFQTPLGEIWRMYEYPNGSYIEAWFSAEENREIVEGINDDVKFLNFQIYNEEGNPLDSVMNSDTLILSKNFGFVKTYRWYQFPDSFRLGKYNLTGIEQNDEKFGFEWDYDQLITSYEIGDIIHLHHDYHGGKVEEYLDKEIKGDTVEYEIKSTTTDYQSMYVEKVQYPLGILPGQSMFDDHGDFLGYKTFDLLSNLWNGKKQYRVRDFFDFDLIEYNGQEFYYREMYNSMSDYPSQYLNDVHYFSKDCGPNGDCWYIVYYKIEDEEWGEPINFQVAYYQAVRPDYTSYFQVYNGLYGIRIDSIEFHDDYSRYYNYPTQQRYEYAEGEYYTDPSASWIGMYVDVFGNGDNIFYDQDYIPFTIKTKANIGDSWVASEHSWGSINAAIISTEYNEIFPDIFDSIKWVQLTYNNQQLDLRLSKNYGLIDFPSFYRFYLHSLIPSLVGIENDAELIGTNFFMNEIMNSLEIGDEVHYRNTAYFGSFFKRKVVDKILSDKKVTYIYEGCGQINQTQPIDTSYYTFWYDTVAFPVNIMPKEIIFDTAVFGSEFYMGIGNKVYDFTCTDVDGFRFSCYVKDDEFEVDSRVFWQTMAYDHFSSNSVNVFAKGIGNYRGPESDSDTDSDVIDYYYNIDGLSCGIPYEINCNTGLNELHNSKFSISPNPNNGVFNIHSSPKIEEVKVYNINGQIVWQANEFNETQIDLSNLSEGLYLLELKTEKQELIHQKVVIKQ